MISIYNHIERTMFKEPPLFRQKYRPLIDKSKKDSYCVNDVDFPELVSSSSNATSEKTSDTLMDFKNCYKPEDPNILKNTRIPGWIYGFADKNKHDIWFENQDNERINIEKLEIDDKPSIEEIMDKLYTDWEKYKEEYIDLFGYDEFEKMFMPSSCNYEDDYDDTEGEDAEYIEDADEIYDEYGDAYDDTYYDK